MRHFKSSLIALAVAATGLGGCVSVHGPSPPLASGDTCGARAFAGQAGRPVAGLRLPAGSRTIGPGTIVTEDYVPTRLNILVDGHGTVTGVRCG